MKKFHHIIPLHKRLLYKLHFWFWWTFQATEADKCEHDILFYGTAITKNGKRIDPEKFNPNELT